MRRLLLISLTAGAAAVIVSALALYVPAAPPGKDMAVVDLPDKTRIAKVVLQGKYIFVHDDEKMAKGEPCFYVYEYSVDQAGKPEARADKLVVSFHCQGVQREKATHIVLTYGMVNPELLELREIQFTGSTEGHRTP